jgi:ribosomal protein L19E
MGSIKDKLNKAKGGELHDDNLQNEYSKLFEEPKPVTDYTKNWEVDLNNLPTNSVPQSEFYPYDSPVSNEYRNEIPSKEENNEFAQKAQQMGQRVSGFSPKIETPKIDLKPRTVQDVYQGAQDEYARKEQFDTLQNSVIPEIDRQIAEINNSEHKFEGKGLLPGLFGQIDKNAVNYENAGKIKRLEEAKRIINSLKDYQKSPKTFWEGVKQSDWSDILTAGFKGLSSSMDMLEVYDKAKKGLPLSEDEQIALTAQSLEQQFKSENPGGFGYEAGQMLTNSIPFMIQMYATGGVGAASEKGASELAKQGMKAYLKSLGKGLIKNAAYQAPRVLAMPAYYKGVTDRLTPDVALNEKGQGEFVQGTEHSAVNSVVVPFLTTFMERYSEVIGGKVDDILAPSIKNVASKFGLGILSDTSKKGGFLSALNNTRKNLGIQGLAGEQFGETLSGVWGAAVDDEQKFSDVFNWDNQGKIFVSSLIFGGLFKLAETPSHIQNYTNISKPYKQSESNLKSVFGEDAELIINANSSDNLEERLAANSQLTNIADTPEKRAAMLDYFTRKVDYDTLKESLSEGAREEVGIMVNKETGQIHPVMVEDKEMFITNTQDGVASVFNPETGKIELVSSDKISDEMSEVVDPEMLVQNNVGKLLQSQDLVGETLNIQGKEYSVDAVDGEIVSLFPADGNGEAIELPMNDVMALQNQTQIPLTSQPTPGNLMNQVTDIGNTMQQQQELNPQVPVNTPQTWQIGNKNFSLQTQEDGSFVIPFEDGKDNTKIIEKEIDDANFEVVPITEEVPIPNAPAFAKKKTQTVVKGVRVVPKINAGEQNIQGEQTVPENISPAAPLIEEPIAETQPEVGTIRNLINEQKTTQAESEPSLSIPTPIEQKPDRSKAPIGVSRDILPLLQSVPENFEQGLLQYLLSGGRIDRDQFIRYSGLKGKDLNPFFGILKKGGQQLDTLNEVVETYGKNSESMDLINEAVDIITSNPGKRAMGERLQQLFASPFPVDLTEFNELETAEQQAIDDFSQTEELPESYDEVDEMGDDFWMEMVRAEKIPTEEEVAQIFGITEQNNVNLQNESTGTDNTEGQIQGDVTQTPSSEDAGQTQEEPEVKEDTQPSELEKQSKPQFAGSFLTEKKAQKESIINNEKESAMFSITELTPIVEEVYNDQVKVNGEWYSNKILERQDYKKGDIVLELLKFPFVKVGENGYYNPNYISDRKWDQINKLLTKAGFSKRPTQDWIDYFSNRKVKELSIPEHLSAFEKAFEEKDKAVKSDAETITSKVTRHFGLTNNFNEAGYIVLNGGMLDFSGKKDGGMPGTRSYDHREVASVESVDTDMVTFMSYGNIRMKPESNGFELTQKPTLEQAKKIREYLQWINSNKSSYGPMVDFSKKGDYGTLFSVEYPKNIPPSRIINDINNFYDNGVKPVIGNGIRFSLTTFYPNAEKSLNSIQQSKGTPEQWKAMLLKNGAKQDELDWMDWDGFANGKKSITKEEIQNWIDENKVEVKEVTKSVGELNVVPNEEEPYILEVYRADDPNGDYAGTVGEIIINGKDMGNYKTPENKKFAVNIPGVTPKSFDTQKAAEEYIKSKTDLADETKYKGYTIPGGKSYKEVLLTLPDKYTVFEDKQRGKFGVKDSNGNIVNSGHKTYAEAKNSIKYIDTLKDNSFKSSHFDEPNIAAHIRINEFTTKDGKRALNIEEVQSDWAQKGKKEGFAGNVEKTDKDFITYRDDLFKKYNVDGLTSLRNVATQQEMATFEYLFAKENDAINPMVPDMPFKKTDQWAGLGMKWALRYAAENEFDVVTWTTGETQAERYDLSKQVDEVSTKKYPNGTYTIVGYKSGASMFEQNDVPEDKIDDFVGKDLAKKIIEKSNALIDYKPGSIDKFNTFQKDLQESYSNSDVNTLERYLLHPNNENSQESKEYFNLKNEATKELKSISNKDAWNTFNGVDLKVGGEGMKGFYDQILPTWTNKYVKKWGAKVGETEINSDGKSIPVHSVDITPSMVESVMQGQPMFKIGKGQAVQTKQQLQSYFDELNSGSPIVVISNTDEIIEDYKANGGQDEYTISRIKLYSDIKGLYIPEVKTVYIHEKSANVEDTWIHENTHFGLRLVLPDITSRAKLANIVFNSIGENKIKFSMPFAYTMMPEHIRGEEYLSHTAEKYFEQSKLNIDDTYSDEEIKSLLNEEKLTSEQIDKIINTFVNKSFNYIPYDTSRNSGSETGNKRGTVSGTRESFGRRLRPIREVSETGNVSAGSVPESSSKRFAGEQIKRPQSETAAFKNWFGQSKITDENGKPQVYYHATGGNFDTFQPNDKGLIFASPDAQWAQAGFMPLDKEQGTSGSVMPVYVKAENPFDYQNPEHLSNLLENLDVRESIQEHIRNGRPMGIEKPVVIEKIKELGYDSLYVTEEGITNIGVFEPTQVKSSLGNKGTFDKGNPNVLFSINENNSEPPVTEPPSPPAVIPPSNPTDNFAGSFLRPKGKFKPLTRFEKLQENLQDRMLRVKKMLEGLKVTNTSNIYKVENLASSRANAAINEFNDNLFTPIIETFSELQKTGKSSEQTQQYMKAKHAIERNKWMREQSGVNKVFAGMEDEEAKSVVKEYEKDLSWPTLKKLWKQINQATDYTLNKYVEYGFMTKQTLADIKARDWKFYVPLRGWELSEEEKALDEQYNRPVGAGALNPIKKAKGRETESDDPLPYIASMAHSIVAMGEKNRVKQAAVKLVMNNKDRDDLFYMKKVYQVFTDPNDPTKYTEVFERPENPYKVTDENGAELKSFNSIKEAKSFLETDEQAKEIEIPFKEFDNKMHEFKKERAKWKQHEVEAFINGDKYVAVFADPTVAQAINYDNQWKPEVTKAFQESIGKITRMLSANFTAKNPAFIPVNGLRDVAYATIAMGVKHGTNPVEFLKNINEAKGTILRDFFKKSGKDPRQKQLDAYYKEFKEWGGETGYIHLFEIDDLKRQIDRQLRILNNTGTKAQKAYDFVNQAKYIQAAGKLLERMAILSENMSRFATFANMRDKGKTPIDAAYAAKEVTVNFNRKGRMTGALGSVYAFFNASVQGGANALNMASEHKGKFVAVSSGFFAMGVLNALLSSLWDDDDKYKNVNDYIKQTNIVIPKGIGSDSYISIPLPQFFRQFFAAGVLSIQAFGKEKTPEQAVGEVISNAFESLSPVNPVGFVNKKGETGALDLLRPFTPTISTPILDLIMNEDFAGKRIVNTPYTKELEEIMASSQKYTKGTNPILVKTFDELYKLGGGDLATKEKYSYDFEDKEFNKVPLLMDINPSSVEHIIEYYTGGRGKFFSDMIKLSSEIVKGAQGAIEGKEFKEAFGEFNANSIPVLNRFNRTLYSNPANDRLRLFYDQGDELETFKRQKEKYKDSGDYDKFSKMAQDENYGQKLSIYESFKGSVDEFNKLIKSAPNEEIKKQFKEQRDEIIKQYFKTQTP